MAKVRVGGDRSGEERREGRGGGGAGGVETWPVMGLT